VVEIVSRIVLKPIAHLRGYSRNARKHSVEQIQEIANSIRRFGFNVPIVIDQHGMVLAGHARLEAAKLLSMRTVPTICVTLNRTDRRAYIIADNRTAEKATWDWEILSGEIEALSGELQLDGYGFSAAEIEIVQGKARSPRPRLPGEAGPRRTKQHPPVSREGDEWQLGAHRLICGQAEASHCDQLIDHFQRIAGIKALLVSTGEAFEQIAARRRECSETEVLEA
jgi:ParB-like chromosome segregation protein Spo0J